MRISLLLLFSFGISVQGSAQKADSILHSRWNELSSQLKRRSDVIISLAAAISGSAKVDKKALAAMKTKAADLLIYVDTLKSVDSLSLARAVRYDSALTQQTGRVLVALEYDPELRAKAEVSGLFMQLAGCENRLEVFRKRFNAACTAYGRSELFFGRKQLPPAVDFREE